MSDEDGRRQRDDDPEVPASDPPIAAEAGSEWRDPVAGMSFLFVPSGEATLGSPPDEVGRFDDEEPEHPTRIERGFWLGRTPVTQREWLAIMGNNPSYFRDAGEDAPVEQVCWDECLELVRRLNERAADETYGLPAEEAWEYACRAGTGGPFYSAEPDYCEANCNTADPVPPLPLLDRFAWWCGNAGETTHRVAEKEPDAWGLYDMLGNVWEWCWDCSAIVSGDGPGAPRGFVQAIRGGPWYGMARCVRCADRHTISAGFSSSGVGVRLARRPAGADR